MDKIVLITGATRGIGFEAARQLVARGARVIITSRDVSRAREASGTLGCESVQLDFADSESVERAADFVGQSFGRIDVLINNAAVLLDHYQSLLQLKPETLGETLATNLIGTHRVTLALLPLLQRSSDPRIVNISSGAGQLDGDPQPWAPAYSISKTALNMFTQQLTAVLPQFIVNSMCPGWCRTDMGGPDATRSAEEGADTAVWLALDAPPSLRGRFVKDRQVIPW